MSTYFVLVALLITGGVWMLWDAIRRRADAFWLALLILLFPFSWPVYFIAVKVRDYEWGRTFGAPTPRSRSLEELEARAFIAGTPESRLDLADALEEQDRTEDAEPIYRGVLSEKPEDLRALHGLARTLLSSQRPAEAVESLEKVLERDRSFRGYSAALDYAEALWQNGQRDDTLELLEAMAATTGRMNHRVAHAHYLAAADQKHRAREVLEAALEAFETFHFVDKRREQYWAIRAEQMLDDLSG